MPHESLHIDPRLWDSFSDAATRQKKKPQALLAQLMREYLETQEDKALFADMRHDLRGRTMNDAEAVLLVKRYRREKRLSHSSRKDA